MQTLHDITMFKEHKTANDVLRELRTHFAKAFITLKMSHGLMVPQEGNFISDRKKTTIFPVQVFMTFTKAQ